VLGLVAGLLIGLSLALAVALYITKAPVPFVNKVPQRTAEQDQAEQERNKSWDPNAPLAGKAGKAGPSAAATGGASPTAASAPPTTAAVGTTPPSASAPAAPSSRDPAAILAGSPVRPAPGARVGDPFQYFVQTGAFTRQEEAEQQRARLGLVGQVAKISEREQQGRTVYRVRLGPFETRAEADGLLGRLQEASIDGQLVRVERP